MPENQKLVELTACIVSLLDGIFEEHLLEKEVGFVPFCTI
jgi:hypothetical protein